MYKTNKTEQVLNHLQCYGSITSLDAIGMYGATRLSAIIYNLRKRGYVIDTIRIPFTDRYGNYSWHGKYILQH